MDVSYKSCSFFREQFRLDKFLFSTHEPQKLATAESGGCQLLYILYRLLVAIWWLGAGIYLVLDFPHAQLDFEAFLTHWAVASLILSSILQLVCSVHHYVTAPGVGHCGKEDTPFVYKLNWMLYDLSMVNIFVTLGFWPGVAMGAFEGNPEYPTSPASIIAHGITSAYVIFDLLITGIPFRILHFYLPIAWSGVYMIFYTIYWALTDHVIYVGIIDYNQSVLASVGFIIASAALLFVIHILLFFVYWLRLVIHDKLSGCCKSGSFDIVSEKQGIPGHDNHAYAIDEQTVIGYCNPVTLPAEQMLKDYGSPMTVTSRY